MPVTARAIAEENIGLLKEAGIGGVYILGNNSEPICRVAVSLDRGSMALFGGLNPLVAAVEAGMEVENIAESGLIDFQHLVSFEQL